MAKKKTSAAYTAYGEASAQEMIEIINACHAASQPIMVFSAPGTGKTSAVIDWSRKKFGLDPTIVIGAVSDPTDINGLPSIGSMELPDGTSIEVTNFLAPRWQMEVASGKSKVLFLDEFSNTVNSVQAAMLNLVQSRITPQGFKIPDDCAIIMAGNPSTSSADFQGLSAPMSNRITLISYKPTDEEVYEGLTGGWFSEEEQAAWSNNERAWRNRIVDFLRHTNGAYILMENDLADGALESEAPAYLQPDAENSDSEREILTTAWASPRAWDNVARVLSYTGFEKKVTPIQERILAGTVGRKATVPLMEYVEEHAKLDPFTVIKHPEMQEWHVNANAAGAGYNDILALARAINESVPKCDGLDGRPTPQEALDFYDKVIDLGGGAHFMTAYCQDNNGPGHYFKKNIPEGVERRDWMAKINGILVKFRDADLIPDAKAK